MFEDLPKTLEDFQEMKKSWLGFERAFEKIGFSTDEVYKRLKRNIPLYDDENEMRERIKKALRYVGSTIPEAPEEGSTIATSISVE